VNNKKEWFGEWFDSPYYHILYKHRDHEEARAFIDNLCLHFRFNMDHHILDLACGKGRHSIYLNQKGFRVTGIDLSPENIRYARKYANESLDFFEHDMRKVFREEEYDFILNLFTSFGYFDTKKENQQAISAAAAALKPGGHFLIDFLNPYCIIHNLVPSEEKLIDGIEFHVSRQVSEDGFILKDIQFTTDGDSFKFQEKVKAIRQVEFRQYFENAGLKVIKMFGDYNLTDYNRERSVRMIFILEK